MERPAELRSLLPDLPVNRRQVLIGTLASGFALAVRPVGAATITTSADGLVAGEVRIPVRGGEQIPGYRAMPVRAAGFTGRFPTVLVVEEIFGVHEHIRDVCRRFAHQGYCAIAPELFARQGDVSSMSDINEILKSVVSKTPDAQVLADLDDTLTYIAGTGDGDPGHCAITGFCWGGRISWLYAAHMPTLRAAVAWYGRLTGDATELQPTQPIDYAATLKVPVLGLYGGADQGIPQDSVEKMRAALARGSSGSEIIVYPDTPHGFNADYRPSYREAAAKDGWARALAWFEAHGVTRRA